MTGVSASTGYALTVGPNVLQVITTPFHPGYITAERIAKAPNLKLALTAGIGSDHVDLQAASKAGITVAEITGMSRLGLGGPIPKLLCHVGSHMWC